MAGSSRERHHLIFFIYSLFEIAFMKSFYYLLFIQLFAFNLVAQTSVIQGTVSDEKGAPIEAISVTDNDGLSGTFTDENGQFEIPVTLPTTLTFSSIGFISQEITISEPSKYLSVTMAVSNRELDEVVVTALGLSRSKRDLGYSVQNIESHDISEIKSPNFVDNLSAKVAGVTVSHGASGIGSTSKITIRGESSFTNNNPLFVVDGIPINNNSIVNNTSDAAAGFQEIDFGNGAMDVNPDDIKEISILKGPGAAALYGTRASNGVILITTKDGSQSKGIGVSLNSTTYFERPFQLPKFQNKYGQGNSGQFEYVDGLGGGINDNISYSWGPSLNEGLNIPQFTSPVTLPDGRTVRGGDIYVHGGRPIQATPFTAYPDNLKNFYETGYTTINNIAFGSGFDGGSYRLSFTDLRNESIIPGVNFNRQTIAGKMNFISTERLTVSTSLNYIRSNSDNRPSSGYGSENVNYALVAWGPRSLDIDAMKDYWQPGLENRQQYSFNYSFFDNPYFTLFENKNALDKDRVFGNVRIKYAFSDQLSLSLRSGTDFSDETRSFRRAFSSNRFQTGAYAVHDVGFREINSDILLKYQDEISAFTYDVSLGANRMDQKAQTKQSQALSLAQPGVFNLSNAAVPIEVFEFVSEKRINSVYGLINLGYKDYLFLEATARNDWSSALATPTSSENTSFFYPSVSASFILSHAVRLPEEISYLKLRGSLAQVGNDTDPYQTTGVYQTQTPYLGSPTLSDQATISNANLLPEKTTALELGGEIKLLKNLLHFDVAYYDALTENQIISLPVSVSSGYDQKIVNGGKVRSRGLEVIASVVPLKGKLQWQSQFNFSKNVTTVESLPDEVKRLTLAYSRIYDNVNQTVFYQVEEGGRIGDMYGTGYLRNAEGEFIISEDGLYIPDNELKKLGNYNPDFILGFANQFSYQNWGLSILLDWRQGGQIISRTLALAAVAGQLEETSNRPDEGIIADGVVNIGSPENPEYVPNTNAVSAETFYRNYYDRNHEENNLYNASYLKLREVSLTYRFKTGMFKKDRSLEIALLGRNLFAWSEIPHFDPEQLAVQGNRFVSGVEDMSYASTRSFGVRISLNI